MILQNLDDIEWTAQSIFDHVCKHLLIDQKELSYSYNRECAYRTTNRDGKTLACGIGCLIPDEYYSKGIESNNIEYIMSTNFELEESDKFNEFIAFIREKLDLKSSNLSVDFINSLQYAHDKVVQFDDREKVSVDCLKLLRQHLSNVAEEYYLEMNV